MEQNVAGYFRVSQARDDMRAPDMYRDEIERYCRYRGVVLADVFSDIDYSGYRGAKPRPALEELKTRRFEFSSVIIPKLSRFGRSVKDLVQLFDIFDNDGIALVFLDMNVDTSTSQGRLLRHIMAAFAEYESDVKSDYSKATQRLLAREGRPHGPLAPYGYTTVGKRGDRTYVEDPERAAVVRELFHRYLSGVSLNSLALELNDRGVRGIKGGDWSRQRVKTILDNPAYAAFRIYDGEEFPASWPPLVSRDVWDEVKRKRHANRTTYNDPPGYRNHLLSGLIVCGLCRKNLHHGHHNDRDSIYRCTTGDARPPRCLGGQIKAARAEALITQAFFDAVRVMNGSVWQADTTTRRWPDATLVKRRGLLSEAIARAILLPRAEGNRHGRGLAMGRSIKVVWTDEWSRRVFGYVGATSTLSPMDRRITSAQGKSWNEWRRLRLLSP